MVTNLVQLHDPKVVVRVTGAGACGAWTGLDSNL